MNISKNSSSKKNPPNNSENLGMIPRKSLIYTLEILENIPYKILNNILENPCARIHLGGPGRNAATILYMNSCSSNPVPFPLLYPAPNHI